MNNTEELQQAEISNKVRMTDEGLQLEQPDLPN
jgi:hypothetical protein